MRSTHQFAQLPTALAIVLGAVIPGCDADSIVGDWAGENAEVELAMTIEDDLRGSGEAFVHEDGGFVCRFDVDVETRDDSRYEVGIVGVDGCGAYVELECELDVDELVCDRRYENWPRLVLRRE